MKKTAQKFVIAIMVFSLLSPLLIFIGVQSSDTPIEQGSEKYETAMDAYLKEVSMIGTSQLKFKVDITKSASSALNNATLSDATGTINNHCMRAYLDSGYYGFECEANLDYLEAAKEYKFFLDIELDDGAFAKKVPVTVPVPEGLIKPEITAPTQKPNQGDLFAMSFKDIGADRYFVGITLCHEYQNDGVNPCLEGDSYEIIRQNGSLQLAKEYSYFTPQINTSSDTVTISSKIELTFEDAVEYEVKAVSEKEINGITHLAEHSSLLVFKLEEE